MMGWLKKLFGWEAIYADAKEKEVKKDIARALDAIKDEIEPKVDPYMAEYHDWEKRCSSWHQATVCHCGYRVEVTYHYQPDGHVARERMPRGNVCPECGHTDKWENCVVRYESEFSRSKKEAILRDYPRWDDPFYAYPEKRFEEYESAHRNIKIVKWTEDHCKVNEDSSQ